MAENSTKPRVAIIGAGLAGLGAASTLVRGNFEITIFEGSNRVGGRVYPFEFGDGFLHQGAEYINGTNNEIYHLAVDRNLLDQESRIGDAFLANKDTVVVLDGQVVDRDIVNEFKQFITLFEEVSENKSTEEPEKDLERVFMDEYEKWVQGNKNAYQLDQLAKLHLKNIDTEWSGSASDIAAINVSQWQDGCDVEDSALLGKIGFQGILDHYRSLVPEEIIRFHCEIVKIDYGEIPLQITSSKGDVEKFDHVIVTSSLGYLKKHRDELFTPALSKKKSDAIDLMGYGSNMKIFLEYDSPWWPKDAESILISSSKMTPMEENFMVFQPSNWCENILVAWIAGDGPLESSKLDDVALIDFLNSHLKKNLAFYDVGKIRRIFRHTWIDDRFALGSYSYLTPDAVSSGYDVIKELSMPIEIDGIDRVLFAGEHTHHDMYQTTIGAVSTGQSQATRLLTMYN